MPEEANVIAPSRFLRWALLALLIAGGVVLYFRYGTRLPTFGSAPAAGADTTR
jgi:hypothetical protein